LYYGLPTTKNTDGTFGVNFLTEQFSAKVSVRNVTGFYLVVM